MPTNLTEAEIKGRDKIAPTPINYKNSLEISLKEC